MKAPDTGIHGISIDHLNGLREAFDCYYSDIFRGIYQVDTIEDKLVRCLIWSVEKDGFLPSKEKFLEYEAIFKKDREGLKIIGKILGDKK